MYYRLKSTLIQLLVGVLDTHYLWRNF